MDKTNKRVSLVPEYEAHMNVQRIERSLHYSDTLSPTCSGEGSEATVSTLHLCFQSITHKAY